MRYVPIAMATMLAAAAPALALQDDHKAEQKKPQDASRQLQPVIVLPDVDPPASMVSSAHQVALAQNMSPQGALDPQPLTAPAHSIPFVASQVDGVRDIGADERPPRLIVDDVTPGKAIVGDDDQQQSDKPDAPVFPDVIDGQASPLDVGHGQKAGADDTPADAPAKRVARQMLDQALLDLADEIERESLDIEDFEVVGHMIAQWAFTHEPEYPRMCVLRQRLLDEVERLQDRAREAYLTQADVKELETHVQDADIERLTSQLQWRIRQRGGDAELYAELTQAIEERMSTASEIDSQARKLGAELQSAVDELVATASTEVALWKKVAYKLLQAKIQYALSELEAHAAAFGASRSDYERLQQLWIDRARLDAGQLLPDCE